MEAKCPLVPKYPREMVDGTDITASKFEEHGFDTPLVVKQDGKENLGLIVPNEKTTLQDVANIVGRSHPVKLIEVGTQNQLEGHTLGMFADYLAGYTPGAHKVLNMITLECSATPLSSHIQAPKVVRDMDWIDNVWPLERRARGDFPSVRGCTMGIPCGCGGWQGGG